MTDEFPTGDIDNKELIDLIKSDDRAGTSTIDDVEDEHWENVEFEHSDQVQSDDSNYEPEGLEEFDDGDDYEEFEDEPKRRIAKSTKRKSGSIKIIDDNLDINYERRISDFLDKKDVVKLKDKWSLPRDDWEKLFPHQKEGVQWMLKKYDDGVGGILADEMGLGKTIQAIVFMHILNCSQVKCRSASSLVKGLGPALLLCPPSLINQWCIEIHNWFPKCRVFVYHSICSTGMHESPERLLNTMGKGLKSGNGSIFITTYNTYVKFHKIINSKIWHVVLLDEGHAIKNFNTLVSRYIREIACYNRFVLTSSPIQNNLAELWSLINFIFPEKLGSFTAFQENFIKPITNGTHVNSSAKLREIAYQCSIVLQKAVAPYIMRRLKQDIQSLLNLPEKTEQILFCKLTKRQRKNYQKYLKSDEVRKMINGNDHALKGISKLCDICNHPAIFEGYSPTDKEYGSFKDSGKFCVIMKLLKAWKAEGKNKVLLFSKRLNVIEMFKIAFEKKGYNYLTLTGNTPTERRFKHVDQFEKDENIFVLLMTPKVGGVGLNLVAANKVLIFDPDWNPTNDQQAKERAWRIGQSQNVTIYRLVTVGTIEEKIYTKQVHKEVITKMILEDAKVNVVVPKAAIKDLFTLSSNDDKTEIGEYISGEVVPRKKTKKEGSQDNEASTSMEEMKPTSSKMRINKKDLSEFEDQKTLKTLFNGNMLASIISHKEVLSREQDDIVLQQQAKQFAIQAARQLIHTDSRSLKKWKKAFENRLHNKTEEKQYRKKASNFWETVHKSMPLNDDEKDTERLVNMAMDLRSIFLQWKKLDEEKVKKFFGIEKMGGIEKYFFYEMLNTLALFDENDKKYELRPKYK